MTVAGFFTSNFTNLSIGAAIKPLAFKMGAPKSRAIVDLTSVTNGTSDDWPSAVHGLEAAEYHHQTLNKSWRFQNNIEDVHIVCSHLKPTFSMVLPTLLCFALFLAMLTIPIFRYIFNGDIVHPSKV